MALSGIGNLFAEIWSIWEVRFVVFHIALNLAIALAAAIRTSTFEFAKVAEFLYKKLLPNLIVFAVAKAVSGGMEMEWLVTATWALIEMSLLGDMVENLKKLGIPIPNGIVSVFKRGE